MVHLIEDIRNVIHIPRRNTEKTQSSSRYWFILITELKTPTPKTPPFNGMKHTYLINKDRLVRLRPNMVPWYIQNWLSADNDYSNSEANNYKAVLQGTFLNDAERNKLLGFALGFFNKQIKGIPFHDLGKLNFKASRQIAAKYTWWEHSSNEFLWEIL